MFNNHIYDKKFTEPFEDGGLPMHVDLPRLREGLNGGAFWSVYTPCPANGTDFSDENYAASQFLTSACLPACLGRPGLRLTSEQVSNLPISRSISCCVSRPPTLRISRA